MIDKEESYKLAKYLKACIKGDIDYVKENTLEIVLNPNYFRNSLAKASSNNQIEVVKHLFKVFDEEQEKIKLNNYGYAAYRFNFQNDENIILEVCEKGHLDIFKLFVERLGGIQNPHRYERCFRHAFSEGQLEIIKYLLSIEDGQKYIYHKTYYNSLFDTSQFKGTNIIKYFLDNEELNKHIKELKLLDFAYHSGNREIVEYLIFDKDMLYSKKIKKAVQNMTNIINVPDLFHKREIIKMAKELEQELNNDTKSCKRLKI